MVGFPLEFDPGFCHSFVPPRLLRFCLVALQTMSADAKTAPAAAPKFDLPTLLKGSKGVLIDAKGQTYPVANALKDKVVGLYFSASW